MKKKQCKNCYYYEAHRLHFVKKDDMQFYRKISCAVAPGPEGPICGGYRKKKISHLKDIFEFKK